MNMNVINLLINLIIATTEIFSFATMNDKPISVILREYTCWSNFLALVCSTIMCVLLIKMYLKKDFKMPKYAGILQFLCTVALTITLIVVFTVLIPLYGDGGFEHYLTGRPRSYFEHLINPILMSITFILSKKYYTLNKKEILVPIVYTLIYGIIMIVLNILNIIEGPYKFLRVTKQPLYMTFFWIIVILLAAYIISLIYYKINNGKKNKM